jgi:hypothetical protein
VSWNSPGPGEQIMSSDLVCFDAQDRPERVRDSAVVAVILAGWLIGVLAYASLRRGLARGPAR